MNNEYKLTGYPFKPKICKRANCGPTVLSGILGIDTVESINLMDATSPKGWNGYTNINHIRRATLEEHESQCGFCQFMTEYQNIRNR